MNNQDKFLRAAYKEGERNWKSRIREPTPLITPLFVPKSYEDKDVEQDIFVPTSFEEYIGQERAKDLARIMIGAAEKENRKIPNILIAGSYGLGKTTLAQLIYKDVSHNETTGSAANEISWNEKIGGYFLIDEIHNLRPEVCDNINKVLDENRVKIIGCTTNPGLLPGPFRSRFRILQLMPYTIDDLTQIQYNAVNKKATITAPYQLLEEVSKRGRNTPRQTLQYLSFIMDLMVVKDEGVLTLETLEEAFDKLGVDNLGLTQIDHQYLDALPNDRAVGLQYLTAVLQVDKDTIEQEIEPYLMSLKLIDRTARGRGKIADLVAKPDFVLDKIFGETNE